MTSALSKVKIKPGTKLRLQKRRIRTLDLFGKFSSGLSGVNVVMKFFPIALVTGGLKLLFLLLILLRLKVVNSVL